MLHWEILLLLMFSAVDLLGEHSRVAVPVAAHVAAEISLLQPGLEKTRFFFKNQLSGFFWVICFFWFFFYIYLPKRESF